MQNIKPEGLNIYTVRNMQDGDYKNGMHISENMYENDGFIVHFLTKKVNQLTDGFRI